MNITEWGRVGYAGQSKTFASAGRAFMDSKIREKTGKGYRPQQVLSGSKPASVQVASASELAQLAKTQIVTNNPLVDQLVARLVRANVHHILQSTTMQYDASKGTFSTPLGIVDQLAIDATRAILVQIGSYVQTSDYDSRSFMDNVNDYLMLVSQNIGMGRLDLCLSLPLKSYPIVRTRLVWRCRETCTRLLLAGSSPSAVLILAHLSQRVLKVPGTPKCKRLYLTPNPSPDTRTSSEERESIHGMARLKDACFFQTGV